MVAVNFKALTEWLSLYLTYFLPLRQLSLPASGESLHAAQECGGSGQFPEQKADAYQGY